VLDRVVAGIALGAAAAGFFIARGIDDPWWLVAAAVRVIYIVLMARTYRRIRRAEPSRDGGG